MEWLTDMAAKRAELSPDKTAFVDHDTGAKFTFSDVNDRANRTANALLSLGAQNGDRIAVLCLNRADFFVLLFAAQKTGIILVPLNWRQPEAELEPILALSKAKLIIHDDEFRETALNLANTLDLPRYAFGSKEADGLDSLIIGASPDPVGDGRIAASAPWYLLFTSGTTGMPKAVIQTAGMAWANTINYSQATGLSGADRCVNYLPLFHTAGINLPTLPLFLLGGLSYVLSKFDADAVVDLLAKGELTSFFAVPAIYQALALHPRIDDVDFSRLKSLGCGGAPVPAHLLTDFLNRGATICNGMGMTETGPTVFLMDPENAADKIGSVGKAQILSEVRLEDVNGKFVQGAGEGELQLEGDEREKRGQKGSRALSTAHRTRGEH